MNMVSDLSEPVELHFWPPSFKIMVQQKLSRGQEMIDIRSWVKWNTDGAFHPGRNGMMVEKKVFKDSILPKLNAMFTSNA